MYYELVIQEIIQHTKAMHSMVFGVIVEEVILAVRKTVKIII